MNSKIAFTFCTTEANDLHDFHFYRSYFTTYGYANEIPEMRKKAEADANEFGVPVIFYYGSAKKIIMPKYN